MSIFIKICGIGDQETALVAAEAGADAIGFVFYAGSSRVVSAGEATAIASVLPKHIEKVAVFLRPRRGQVEQVLDVFPADTVQADFESLPQLAGVRLLPVFRSGGTVGPAGGRFLFEGPRSGSGESVDRRLATALTPKGRMVLAGGLDPHNVAKTIRDVRPYGVDVSSGVESAPGVKDVKAIRAFVREVRTVEKEVLAV